jgi:hypothetical protein
MWDAELAFHKPQRAFTKALVVQDSDPRRTIIPLTYASGFAIAVILN